MKYETPEMTALMPAINAIQTTNPGLKVPHIHFDGASGTHNEGASAYMDWE